MQRLHCNCFPTCRCAAGCRASHMGKCCSPTCMIYVKRAFSLPLYFINSSQSSHLRVNGEQSDSRALGSFALLLSLASSSPTPLACPALFPLSICNKSTNVTVAPYCSIQMPHDTETLETNEMSGDLFRRHFPVHLKNLYDQGFFKATACARWW